MCFSHLGVFLISVKPLTTENTENKTPPKICKNYSRYFWSLTEENKFNHQIESLNELFCKNIETKRRPPEPREPTFWLVPHEERKLETLKLPPFFLSFFLVFLKGMVCLTLNPERVRHSIDQLNPCRRHHHLLTWWQKPRCFVFYDFVFGRMLKTSIFSKYYPHETSLKTHITFQVGKMTPTHMCIARVGWILCITPQPQQWAFQFFQKIIIDLVLESIPRHDRPTTGRKSPSDMHL